MIQEYHRPKTIDEAITLLSRTGVSSRPLGGGTAIGREEDEPLAVVDLQDLAMDKIEERGNWTDLGATVTLQAILDTAHLPEALYEATRWEASYNLRQIATVVGTLVAADGRSAFTTTMLALDAVLHLRPGKEGADLEQVHLGDFLSFREEMLRGRLITQATIPTNASLVYRYVARTPADRPIVCAAVARWPAGRTRVALGGYGKAPVLAMDGPEAEGAEIAARNAYSGAGDPWASAEYREEVAGLLVRRSIEELK